jgi:hypothetical protein
MKLVQSSEVYVPVEPEEEGQKTRLIRVGLKLEFTGGVEAFWSYAHRTVSVTYPAVPRRYRSGTVETNTLGEVVMEPRVKNGAMKLREFVRAYGEEFVREVCLGIAGATG